MFASATVAVALGALVAHTAAFCLQPKTPGPSEFNLALMLGGWHQVYCNTLVYDWLESGTTCDAAHYKLNSDGTVAVNNTAVRKDGSPYGITGTARQTHPKTHPAELTVQLAGVPLPAPLWWLHTSSNSTGRYEWAIGSDPYCATLFVVSRTAALSLAHAKQVEAALSEHGWSLSNIVKIPQPSTCPPL